jgi:hypothetical protein
MRAVGFLVLASSLALLSCARSTDIKDFKIESILGLRHVAIQVHRSNLGLKAIRLFDEAVARTEMNGGCYEIREGETVGDVIAETQAYDTYWRNYEDRQRKAARITRVLEPSTCFDFPGLSEYQQRHSRRE